LIQPVRPFENLALVANGAIGTSCWKVAARILVACHPAVEPWQQCRVLALRARPSRHARGALNVQLVTKPLELIKIERSREVALRRNEEPGQKIGVSECTLRGADRTQRTTNADVKAAGLKVALDGLEKLRRLDG